VGLDPSQTVEPVADCSGPRAPSRRSTRWRAKGSRRGPSARRSSCGQRGRSAEGRGRGGTQAGDCGRCRGGLRAAEPEDLPRAERWDDSWDAGVNVTWSLWDGGRVAADVAQAAGAADAVRARLREFDSVLAVEVRQRSLEISSGTAAIAAADEAVRAAAEARRVVGERYRAGVIPQGDVLEAELQLLQSQLDRTRAQASVRLAEARLDRVLGR
jgi:hypothetical protein